jgi:GNAT superfamily N-acetyltransferase
MPAHRTTPGPLALRPIQPGDEEALHAIFAATREAERQQLGWSGPEHSAAWDAFTRQQFAAQHAQYMRGYANPTFSLVLHGGSGDDVAGRLYVDRTPAEIRIIDIALLPAHQRQGLGGRLLRALAEESDACGIPLGLHVEKNNPILGAYERLGLQAREDRGVYLYMQRPPQPPRLPGPDALAASTGSAFELHDPAQLGCAAPLATLQLQRATQRQGRGVASLTLDFAGPGIGRPAHATYLLAHPLLGRFPLFLGPVMGGAAGQVHYQATLTRLVPPPEETATHE